MKRGWITWDKTELPPSAFEARLAVVRKQLAALDVPALVVYSDVWRSNQGRYLSNLMPYWNRALLVIPQDSAPVLLCGLSPRVYPWIRSVTILDEIRPSPNIAQQLTRMSQEKGWSKLGVLDLPQIPYDLVPPHAVDVPWRVIHPGVDETELAMYRRAAKMARNILEEEMPGGAGNVDHEFVGRLERRFRTAGVEDLVVLVTSGTTPPLPPEGSTLAQAFSASVAVEYRGHWVKISRALSEQVGGASESKTELLSGPYPYESCAQARIEAGDIFAVQREHRDTFGRLYTGDSYWQGPNGAELL